MRILQLLTLALLATVARADSTFIIELTPTSWQNFVSGGPSSPCPGSDFCIDLDGTPQIDNTCVDCFQGAGLEAFFLGTPRPFGTIPVFDINAPVIMGSIQSPESLNPPPCCSWPQV
jgi:hypothetical protein